MKYTDYTDNDGFSYDDCEFDLYGDDLDSDSYDRDEDDEELDDLSDGISMYLNSLGDIQLLTEEEERELIERYRNGDDSAREKLIVSNLRLVIFIAKKYAMRVRHSSFTLEDLIQEGNMGLIRAVETFNPDKGKFSTYAYNWISCFITRGIENKARVVRLPSGLHAKIRKLLKDNPNYIDINNRENLTKEEHQMFACSLPHYSLDCVLHMCQQEGEEDLTLLDAYSARIMKDRDTVEDEAMDKAMVEEVYLMLDKANLSEKQKAALIMHYGLYGNEPLTYREIGNRCGLSSQAIKQSVKGSMQKLRRYSKKKQLVDFCR